MDMAVVPVQLSGRLVLSGEMYSACIEILLVM